MKRKRKILFIVLFFMVVALGLGILVAPFKPLVLPFGRGAVVVELITWSESFREKVSECCKNEISDGRAEELLSKSLKENVLEKKENFSDLFVDSYYVSGSGSIITYNRKFGVVVIMEPIFVEDKLIWRCIVNPSPKGKRREKPRSCLVME